MKTVELDEVLDVVCKECNRAYPEDPCEPDDCRIRNKLKELPTLTLDELRPKGRWVEKEEPLGWNEVDVAECSICEESWVLGEYSFEDFAELHRFCPNCGADMRGGGEDAKL